MIHSRYLWVVLSVALLFPAVAAAEGETTTIQKIIDMGRNDNQVMEHLDTLVNRFGPRLTGSNALVDASEWARDQFESWGLTDAHLEEAGEFPIGFNRGPWWGRMVSPEKYTLEFNTNSWTAGTKGVVRGPAILVKGNLEEVETQKDELKGAWALLATPRRMSRQHSSFLRQVRKKLEEYEVAGVVTGTRGALLHTSGRSPKSWSELPKVPQVRVSAEDWKMLAERLEKKDKVELEFQIQNYFKPGPVKYYNVIADIPGTEYPDEYVVVGGHIDSWDGATGTLDNGTGVATTMEAARMLMASGAKPRRTIRFMLWGGEEQGLLGSKAWLKQNPDLHDSISACLVHDGGTNYLAGLPVTEAMFDDMTEAFASVVGLDDDMPFALRKVQGLPVGIGSDHDAFLRAGIPGFFWDQKGRSNYNRSHHTQFDTYDMAIPEYQLHSAMVVALGALGVANLDGKLSREKMMAPPPRRMGVFLDGLKISRVMPDTPAQKAGLKEGDVFVTIDGRQVTNRRDLLGAIRSAGYTKKATIKRGDQTLEVEMVWPKPKAEPKKVAF